MIDIQKSSEPPLLRKHRMFDRQYEYQPAGCFRAAALPAARPVPGAPGRSPARTFPCGQGQLLLGRKKPCAWLGQQMGAAPGGHFRRQSHHRHIPALWYGLFRFCRLGILQCVRWRVHTGPRRWSCRPAPIL